MRRFFLLSCLMLILGFGALLRASNPPMNELLVALDTRRASAVGALRAAALACPAGSPMLGG